MKRFLFALLFSCISLVNAQEYEFAWLTDIHIGYPEADTQLDSIVNLINYFEEIKFVIATGDIAEKGRDEELERAKEVLDQLNVPYYIIPGNHDTKWCESGGTKFIQLWRDDKFSFKHNNDLYIGLNSGIPWRGGGGHIKPDDLRWLENELSDLDSATHVYLAVHHPLNDDIDNWFEVTNRLQDVNVKAVLFGHGHTNKMTNFNGIPAVESRSTLSKGKDSWGFTLVKNKKDTLEFYEVEKDTVLKKWGMIDKTKAIDNPIIDSTQFISYDTKIDWQIDLESTLSAEPLYHDGYIYTAAYDGIVTCFDTTGAMIWDYDAFGNIVSRPAVMDGYLAVATAQGDLVTLNAYSGEQIQTLGFDDYITSQLIMIEYNGTNELMLPKMTDSKAAVIVGTASGRVYCYDVETLQEYWINETSQGMIETKPLHVNNKLIYGSWDSNIYCIDAKKGWLIWKWSETDNFYYSPAACKPITDGKRVYVTSPEKYVFAIDLNLGTTDWKKNNYNAWESIGISNNGKLLLVKSFQDHFHVVSTITSNWVKDINMKFGIDTMPVTPIEWNKQILFGAKNGRVYKINENYRYQTILFLGSSRVHSVQHIGGNMFIVSNMDGKVVQFRL